MAMYQEVFTSDVDSVKIVGEDTTTINPILSKLSSPYDWNKERKNWKRDPFAVPRIETVVIKPKIVRQKRIDESAGLTLNGIIQVDHRKKAMINGRLYEIGSLVNDLLLVDIETNYVIVRSSFRSYTLYLKNH